MSIKATCIVWEHSPEAGVPLLILLALADFANERGEVWPSRSTLAKKARTNDETVRLWLKSFVASGVLLPVEASAGGQGHSTNRYRINLDGLDKKTPYLKGKTTGQSEPAKASRRGQSTEAKGAIYGSEGGNLRKPASSIREQSEEQSNQPSPPEAVREVGEPPTPSAPPTADAKVGKAPGEKSGTMPLIPLFFDTPEFRASLTGFIEMRKKIRAPLTERAAVLLFRELEKFAGQDAARAADILDTSTLKGWRGVFDPNARPSRDRGQARASLPVPRAHSFENLPELPARR